MRNTVLKFDCRMDRRPIGVCPPGSGARTEGFFGVTQFNEVMAGGLRRLWNAISR